MENNPISNERLAELDRLHEAAIKGMNWQEVAQFQTMIAEQYQPLRQRLLAAEARLEEVELERAWANPDKFAEAQRSTPPNRTGRQQIDAARGTK